MGDVTSISPEPASAPTSRDIEQLRDTLTELVITLANRQQDVESGVSARSELIRDLNAFLFKNIPYRNVVASNLSQGLIEIEDMAGFDEQAPTSSQLPYWYFGSKAYRIARAVRIEYAYAYPLPGQMPSMGSLFFGFQGSSLGALAQLHDRANGAFAPSVLAKLQSDPKSATPGQLSELVKGFLGGGKQATSKTQFTGEIKDFDEFVVSVLHEGEPSYHSFVDRQKSPERRWLNFDTQVGYSGIAQDNDPSQPFPYNLAELAAANRLDELILWHFAGHAYRITKAIRLTYTSLGTPKEKRTGDDSGTLLIGYQGPHAY